MRQIQCLDDDDDDHDYSELQQFLSPDPNRTFIRRGVAMIARVKSTSRLWDSIRSFGRRKRAVSIDSFSSPASARSAADLSGSLEAPSHLSALDPSSLDARPIKVPPYAKFKLLSLYLLSDLVALLDAETNSGSAILKGYIPFQDAVYCPLSHDFGSFLSLTQSTMHHHSGLTHAWCTHGFSLSLLQELRLVSKLCCTFSPQRGPSILLPTTHLDQSRFYESSFDRFISRTIEV